MNVIDIEMPRFSTRNLNYVTSLTEYLQLLPSRPRPHQRPDKSGTRSQHLTFPGIFQDVLPISNLF